MLWKLATLFLIFMVVLTMVSARPKKGDKAHDPKRSRWARLFRRGSKGR